MRYIKAGLIGVFLCALAASAIIWQRSHSRLEKNNSSASRLPIPTIQNVKYGPHTKNVLDLYQSEFPGPRPAVIYVHGGGWTNFDRHSIHKLINVEDLVNQGVSVVTVDYRFLYEGERQSLTAPVQLPMEDAARAVQFVRSKHVEWNIDSDRIAGFGGSAGACTVLWLTFHDDMAQPDSQDVVLRESTKLNFAFCINGQTTLDPSVMRDWIPNIAYGQNAFGFRSSLLNDSSEFENFYLKRNQGEYPKLIKEYSPISHLTADDPPTWSFYDGSKMPAKGEKQADPTHSALFGAILMNESRNLGRSEDNIMLTEDVRKIGDKLTELMVKTLISP